MITIKIGIPNGRRMRRPYSFFLYFPPSVLSVASVVNPCFLILSPSKKSLGQNHFRRAMMTTSRMAWMMSEAMRT